MVVLLILPCVRFFFFFFFFGGGGGLTVPCFILGFDIVLDFKLCVAEVLALTQNASPYINLITFFSWFMSWSIVLVIVYQYVLYLYKLLTFILIF
jgi:hypothetical protein